MGNNYKISGFSDEISENIKEQFATLNKLGIHYFEPRGINGKNISTLSEKELYELKDLMEEYGIQASSIGSPIGKIRITDDFDEHFEIYKQVVKAAKILGTKYIRVFSFYRGTTEGWTEAERKEVFRRMEILIAYAKEEDVILLHENEKDIYGDTAERCLDLMKHFYGSNFKAIFDPANFVQADEDAGMAYDALKPYIAYMHIKDAKHEDDSVVPAGSGDGQVESVLKDLFANEYDGFLSMEPHLGKFTGLADLELDDKMLELPDAGEQTFALAYQALLNILERI